MAGVPRQNMKYAPEAKPVAEENIPQTQQVFNPPRLNFQGHTWIQQGYEIIDSCPSCPRQGVPIPSGKMLIRERGEYKLIDEAR